MEIKDFGFLAVLIVWGGLFYLFSANFAVPNVPIRSESFSAAAFSAFDGVFGNGDSNEPFGFVDENGNFQKSQAHFKDSVNISQIEFSSSDPSLLFAVSDGGLFASKDAGLNWYSFSDVEHKLSPGVAVYKILFNSENKKQAFVSVFSNGKGTIYKSENNFFSSEKLIEFNSEGVYDFGIKNNNLYLGLSNGRLMVYSLDKNESRILTTFSSPITGLKISPGGNLIYLTLKSGGLYLSYDGGQSFNRLKYLDNYNGLGRVEVSKMNGGFYHVVMERKLFDKIFPKSKIADHRDWTAFKEQDFLRYYQEHYSGLNRRELSQKDKGLYLALFKRGLLDKILPEKNYARGNNHHAWNGGSSFEPYSFDFKTIKKYILERDNHICQFCGKSENGKKHHVHHIDYNKKNSSEDNLITLCTNCHTGTNPINDRQTWQEICNERITEIYQNLSCEQKIALVKLKQDLYQKLHNYESATSTSTSLESTLTEGVN